MPCIRIGVALWALLAGSALSVGLFAVVNAEHAGDVADQHGATACASR